MAVFRVCIVGYTFNSFHNHEELLSVFLLDEHYFFVFEGEGMNMRIFEREVLKHSLLVIVSGAESQYLHGALLDIILVFSDETLLNEVILISLEVLDGLLSFDKSCFFFDCSGVCKIDVLKFLEDVKSLFSLIVFWFLLFRFGFC